jgi:hypothetical protein
MKIFKRLLRTFAMSRKSVFFNLYVALVLGLAPGAVDAQFPFLYTYPPTGAIQSYDITELSGMARASNELEYWCHNDSHESRPENRIFRIAADGAILQSVELLDALNVDWESVTTDGNGLYYLADTGDNLRIRGQYQIYQFAEPDNEQEAINPSKSIHFTYEDGQSHDSEASFWLNGTLYLITKSANDPSRIFKLDTRGNDPWQTADFVCFLDVDHVFSYGRMVTDSAYSPEKKMLVVLTYMGIVFYPVAEEADLSNPPSYYDEAYFGQCESITFDGDDLVIANEIGDIWKYPIHFFLPHASIEEWHIY